MPPRRSVFVASNLRGFFFRANSPRGGEGNFVVGPMWQGASGEGEVHLLSAQGRQVGTCRSGFGGDSCS